MRDHELIEALLAARALGGLHANDESRLRAEMAEHGDCPECRRLERETADAAGRVAFALDPVPVSREFEERVVALALAGRPTGALATAPPAGRTAVSARAWVRPVAAAAAALALFAGGWLVGSSSAGGGFPPTGGRVAAFESRTGGTLALVYRSSEEGMYVIGSGLVRPAPGRTYELWLFRGQTPVRAGCFEPGSGGTVAEFIDVPLGSARTAAVTEEPTACPSAPTTRPLFTVSL